MNDASKTAKSKKLELLDDKMFQQSRGALGDTYYAKAGKGSYNYLFETSAGEFYLAEEADFECEDFYIGGIFLMKDQKTTYLWTMPMFSMEKAKKKLQNEKYLKRIDQAYTTRKPFVHKYYKIEHKDFKLME